MGFECTVCLEKLEHAAPANDDDISTGSSVVVISPKPSRSGVKRVVKVKAPTTETDLTATSCGHMFHSMCIENWFKEQGKKTCPNCRKGVTVSKTIRVFPSVADDNDRSINFGGPSTSAAAIAGRNRTCTKDTCVDKEIHETLMKDYDELQQKYFDEQEKAELNAAQVLSLQDQLDKLKPSEPPIKRRSQSASNNGDTKKKAKSSAGKRQRLNS